LYEWVSLDALEPVEKESLISICTELSPFLQIVFLLFVVNCHHFLVGCLHEKAFCSVKYKWFFFPSYA
jgi:hypothetical protein